MSKDPFELLKRLTEPPDVLKKQLEQMERLAKMFEVPDFAKNQLEAVERLRKQLELPAGVAESLEAMLKPPDWLRVQLEQAERMQKMFEPAKLEAQLAEMARVRDQIKHPLLREFVDLDKRRAELEQRIATAPVAEKQSLKDAVKEAMRELREEEEAAAKAALPPEKKAGFLKDEK